MMAAAPWGWGWGRAGDAYTQWFQPCRESQNYLNLINSHFNFMVEGGWLASVLYLFAWSAVLLLCWPLPGDRIGSVPLAIWVSFGVGASFSHVEESGWLWLLPIGALVCAIFARLRVNRWPRFSDFFIGAAASAGLVASLIFVGNATTSLPIIDRGAVTVGTGPVRNLILVDRHVLGSLFGHAFRKFLAMNPEVISGNRFIFVESSRDWPSGPINSFVVSGRFVSDIGLRSKFNQGTRVILVNPSGYPDAVRNADWFEKTVVYFGEYSQAPSRSAWQNVPGLKAIQINGAGDFVPGWPQAILTPPKA